MVEVALGDAGVGERLLERGATTLDEVSGHLLELRAAERLVEVQRAVGGGGDERQVDLRLLHLAELDLGLLGGLLETLGGHPVGGQVDAVGRLELLDEVVDGLLVQSSPRWVSPCVDLTSKTPSPISSTETSKVPPPRSLTRTVVLGGLVEAVGVGAAVGSLMIRSTSRPAICPASLVAVRWASSKYAGVVITAWVTVSPR